MGENDAPRRRSPVPSPATTRSSPPARCDLARRVAQRVAHDHRRPLIERQLGERADELVRPALGRRRGRGGHAGRRHRVQPPRARVVDRAVDDDLAQPWPERPSPVGAVERAERGDERLLRDVLRGGGVVHDQPRGPVGARPVQREQRLERVARALLGAPHELPLGTLDPLKEV
jgi:hypothetical protein